MNNVESTCEQQGFEILHSVANRVRLRALDTKTKDKLTAIAQHLRTTAGIESVRINKDTGNLVITYDQNLISRAQVQQLLEPYGITEEAPSPEGLGADSYSQTLKRLTSFIPPVVGIAAVRGLGIGGWQGFAAYVVASRVTRGVMNQLEGPWPTLPEKKSSQVKEDKNQTGKPEAIETAQSKKPDESAYRVIHQIPGRIRLSIARVKQDLDYTKKLENLTEWDNRITSVRVNPETGSVVINYRTGTPSNTGKMPLNTDELIALMELIALDEADLKNEASLKERLNPPKVVPQDVEELSPSPEASEISQPEDEKPQEVAKKLEKENVIEQTEIEVNNVLVSEPKSEEKISNEQSASGRESHLDHEEELLSSTIEQPEDSLDEPAINPILSAEQEYKRFELSEEESENPWRRFKACMLTTMLRLMVNFPLQQA